MGTDQFGDRALDDLERHVDLGRDDILILDLGLGQRGLFDRAPHHRLGPAIELAGGGELQEFGDDRRLALGLHGEVGVVPIGHHAQPLELLALHIDPVLGVGAAFGAEFEERDLVLVLLGLAILFLDLPFDRQAVAIPARNVGRVAAQEVLGAADHVLDRVVQRVADVHVAVRVRGPVMVHEGLTPPAGIAQLLVQFLGFPARGNNRLLLGEAGLHRELGLRQEDGVSVVALFSHSWRALAGEAGQRNFLDHTKTRRARRGRAGRRPIIALRASAQAAGQRAKAAAPQTEPLRALRVFV